MCKGFVTCLRFWLPHVFGEKRNIYMTWVYASGWSSIGGTSWAWTTNFTTNGSFMIWWHEFLDVLILLALQPMQETQWAAKDRIQSKLRSQLQCTNKCQKNPILFLSQAVRNVQNASAQLEPDVTWNGTWNDLQLDAIQKPTFHEKITITVRNSFWKVCLQSCGYQVSEWCLFPSKLVCDFLPSH